MRASAKLALALMMLGTATSVSAQRDEGIPPPGATFDESGGGETWTYIKPAIDLSKYDAVLIRPTTVSDSPGAQFDGISPADQANFASVLSNALAVEMPKSFRVVQNPSARTIAIHVTILGAKKTVGGVATATRVLPIGLAMSAFKSLEGKPGTLTGSLLIEVEFANAATGELLAAAVRRRSPDALDVKATVSTTDTVAAIAADLAQTIREKLVGAGMPASARP